MIAGTKSGAPLSQLDSYSIDMVIMETPSGTGTKIGSAGSKLYDVTTGGALGEEMPSGNWPSRCLTRSRHIRLRLFITLRRVETL